VTDHEREKVVAAHERIVLVDDNREMSVHVTDEGIILDVYELLYSSGEPIATLKMTWDELAAFAIAAHTVVGDHHEEWVDHGGEG
jgi:hypothetical protein